LRAVFSRPSRPADGSSTSTASLRRASASIHRRDESLPISSSEVNRNTSRFCGAMCSCRKASTANSAITRPAFMS
jgi:hypothetical protein